jgi:hypothetical protein
MKRILSLAVLTAAVSCLGCSSQESDFPEIAGWTLAGEVLTYEADNLWEYINGAAELFIQYDVQTCRTADFTSGDVTVTIDLYDMGTPLNAFGVFTRESPGRGTPSPQATAVVVSPPYQALLLKGSTYVKVNAVEGELTDPIGAELLEAVAATLSGQTEYPEELGLLPEHGKVPGSEGYQRVGFLGLTELADCLYAEYAGDGDQTWQGFVVLPSASVWDALAGEWESVEHGGLTVLHRQIPYRGLVGVVQTEQAVVGVSGAADQAELLDRLDGFVSRLGDGEAR